MSLTITPYGGLQPVELNMNVDAHWYMITNNYGTNLFVGDPVVKVAGGTIEKATAGTGNPILGSIVALFQQFGPKANTPNNLIPIQYYSATPGTTYNWFAMVADNPNTYFRMQEDGDTQQLVAADLGMNVNFAAGAGGSTNNGLSSVLIDSSSIAVTATLQLKLVALDNIYDERGGQQNDFAGSAVAGTKWIVKINNHQNAANSAGI